MITKEDLAKAAEHEASLNLKRVLEVLAARMPDANDSASDAAKKFVRTYTSNFSKDTF